MTHYSYGTGEYSENIGEAQDAIVAAYDLLISEMCDYMHDEESCLSMWETDEFQARKQQSFERFLERSNMRKPGSPVKKTWSHDPEAEKQRARDENTATLGEYEKRVRELYRLRSVFAETNPGEVRSSEIDKTYRILKIQVMRCALSIGDPHFHNALGLVPNLQAYCKALHACGNPAELRTPNEVFPFTDDEY